MRDKRCVNVGLYSRWGQLPWESGQVRTTQRYRRDTNSLPDLLNIHLLLTPRRYWLLSRPRTLESFAYLKMLCREYGQRGVKAKEIRELRIFVIRITNGSVELLQVLCMAAQWWWVRASGMAVGGGERREGWWRRREWWWKRYENIKLTAEAVSPHTWQPSLNQLSLSCSRPYICPA